VSGAFGCVACDAGDFAQDDGKNKKNGKNRQGQEQKQIPCGDDNQKGDRNDNQKDNDKGGTRIL
jgi:hypothetical protein